MEQKAKLRKIQIPGFFVGKTFRLKPDGSFLVLPISAVEILDPIDTEEASKIAKLSIRQIEHLCDTGVFTSAKQMSAGRHWIISRSEVVAYRQEASAHQVARAPRRSGRSPATHRRDRREASAAKEISSVCSLNHSYPPQGGIESRSPA